MSAAGFATLDPCVHCGFCLQSCPTFLVTGDEADSPRGRIVLMQALARNEIDATDPGLGHHLDRCLGCRGCEPVCPSGVGYGAALETARQALAAARRIPLRARAVLALMAEPALRTPAMALARALRPLARRLAGRSALRFTLGMLGATKPRRTARAAAGVPAAGPAPGTGADRPEDHLRPPGPAAVVFRGCIMSGLFNHVNAATARALRANGFRLADVPGQSCCGALHAHAGDHAGAVALARRNVTAFRARPDAMVVVNSAGCGAMLKQYGALLHDDPLEPDATGFASRVRDVAEVLADAGPRPGAPLVLTVAYDPPCHLEHAQRVTQAPMTVLGAVPGLTQVVHDGASLCCGSAGIFSLLQRELATDVLAHKVDALARLRPDVVATGNPGCIMQIGAGLRAAGLAVPVVHPVELLDESYATAGYYESLDDGGRRARPEGGPPAR